MPGDPQLVKNLQTGEYEQVPLDAIEAGVKAKKYERPRSVAVTIGTDPTPRELSYDEYLSRKGTGRLRGASSLDLAKQQGSDYGAEQHSGIGSGIKSFIGGTIGGLDMGIWSPFQEDQEYHPWVSAAGNLAGAIAPIIATGGGAAPEELGTLGRLAAMTPTARVARGAEALAEMLPGEGRLVRVGRSMVAGTAYGGVQGGGEYVGHVLNGDVPFSAEGLVGSMFHGGFVGGTLGGGLGTAAEALGAAKGAIGRLHGRASIAPTAELEAAGRTAAPDDMGFRVQPWDEQVRMNPTRDGTTAMDRVESAKSDLRTLIRRSEELTKSPGYRQNAPGLNTENMVSLQTRADNALKTLESFRHGAGEVDLGTLPGNLEAADRLALRMREVTSDLPKRWTDDGLRGSYRSQLEATLKDARARGIAPIDEAGLRVRDWLNVGAEDAASSGRGIMDRIGRMALSKAGLGKLGVGALAGEMILPEAARHIVGHSLGHLGAGALGLAAGSKVLQAAFRDPALGGILTAKAADVLAGVHLFPGDRPNGSSDPRQALRSLADRARQMDPASVGSSTVRANTHLADRAGAAVMQAGSVAAQRHAAILGILNAADPPPSQSQALMGRPLPTSAAAARAADQLRAIASPMVVPLMAAAGKLTHGALSAAQAVYPRTVARLRAAVASELAVSRHTDRMSAANRATASLLVGSQDRAAYQTAMAQSTARAHQMTQGQGGAAKGPSPQSVPQAPAVAIGHPGEHR